MIRSVIILALVRPFCDIGPMASITNTSLPAVSVVVPVYQGAATIGECVESLLRLDYPGERLEIIVVNNASTDETADIVRKFPVTLLDESRKGAAIACNTGWKHAHSDLIAFTDADCVVASDWLRHLVPHFVQGGIGGCGGQLAPSKPESLVQEYIILKNILSQERTLESHPGSPPFVVTANVMYRKNALEKIGGLDEALRGAGYDADLSWRVQWADYAIEYEPRAIVWHYHRSTLAGFMRQLRGYGSGESQLFAKHRSRLGRTSYFNSQPYRQMARALLTMPGAAIFGRNRMERALPMLEFLDSFSYVSGKIGMSLRQRVWYF